MIGAVSFRHQWRIHFGRFHHSVAEHLRNRLFSKYSELGPSFFEKNPTGELMSLMINDVNTFRMAVGPGLLILLDALFLIVFIVPFMLSISPDWTWKTMILLPFIPFVIRFMENRIGKASRNNQDRLAELSGNIQELVTGIRVVKGFAQESHRQNAFREFSRKYADTSNIVAKYDSFFEPALQIGVATGSVILLAWSSKDVLSGAVSLGTFVAFHEYIKRMIWPMAAIGSGLSLLQQGRSSYGRIHDVLKTRPDVEDVGLREITEFDSLEVRNLTYTYPGASIAAISNLSFTLRRGEVLGIVGPVGSGKSTLVQLLGRIRQAPPKTVFVNGIAIEEYSVSSWRGRLAIAPQDAFLFSRTVEDNILFGQGGVRSEIAKEDALASADAVAIREEIERLPLGFRAWLGEKGVNLSGGQRQRLTIARALTHAREADIVVLDDSLSAVDGKTEASILRGMRDAVSLGRGKRQTSIVISHRLAAVTHADRVLVLNEGRLEAEGSHQTLLAPTGSALYRRIFEFQSHSPIEDSDLTPVAQT
jgi:ATP-binding cassette subfamily B protein